MRPHAFLRTESLEELGELETEPGAWVCLFSKWCFCKRNSVALFKSGSDLAEGLLLFGASMRSIVKLLPPNSTKQ